MPTTTSRPLARRYRVELLVGVVGLLLVAGLYACNRSRDDGPTVLAPSTTTTVPTTEPTAEAPVEAPVEPSDDGGSSAGQQDTTGDSASASEAVLRPSDLPTGWSRRASGDRAAPLCPGQDPLAATPADGTARAAFQKGADQAFVVGLVAQFGGEAEAKAFVGGVRAAFTACEGYTQAPISGSGDEAVVGRLDAEGAGLSSQARVYVAREGDRVAVISAVAFGTVDDALARRLLAVQLGRF